MCDDCQICRLWSLIRGVIGCREDTSDRVSCSSNFERYGVIQIQEIIEGVLVVGR